MIRRLLACLALVAATAAGASAQKGGRGFSPPAAKPVHGNSYQSTRANHVYQITRTNNATGKTEVFKYGLSSGPVTSARNGSLSYRAESQVRALNASSNNRYTFRSQVVGQADNRKSAVFMEKQAVTKHTANFGSKPVGNLRPSPYAFSPLKR